VPPALGLFGSGAVRDESMPDVRPRKSALIVGYYGAGNAGDEAILNSVLSGLRTAIPDLHPIVVSDDPGSTSASHAVESIGKNDKPALWKAVRGCHMIVLGGGGLLQDYWNVDLSSLFSEGTTFSYYAYAALASLFDKHLLLYAVGVGPLLSETGRRYTRMLAEQAQLILVRDRESKTLLTELGVDGARIHVTADPAFLAPGQPRILDLPQPVLGVALRNWNIGINPEAWESQVTEALDIFLDRHPEGSIVFLPFQLSRSQGDDDEAIANRVRARMRHQIRAAVSEHSGDASSLSGMISRCDVVVGMRYHSVLFAIRTHVPVVGLVYDPKVRNLMASAGCGALALDLNLLRADDLAERIESAYTDADLERRLAAAAATLSLAAADNQRHIGDTFHAASPSTVLRWMDELSSAAVSANDKTLKLAIAERRSGICFPYDVICFPGIEWDFRWMRAQQLMSQFADQGHRTFFLSISKAIPPGRAAFSLNRLRENVWEVLLRLPQLLDVYSDVLPDSLQDAIVEDLTTLAGDFGIGRAVSMLHLPTWAPIAYRLRAALGWPIAYDCMDDWSGFAWMPDSLVEQEIGLVDDADLVIVSAQALWDKWAVRNAKTLLARNGADIAHFQCRIPAAPPPISIPPSRTVVGFFGAIDSWFDVELLAFAAAKRPHYFFAIIGATYDAPVEKLSALTNVRLYGHQPYADLPACLRLFDVCIIPFKINTVTEATDPVKFYEYIAGGKPVVATRLPELEFYREVTYLAEGPEDFTRLLDVAVAEDDAKRIEQRQTVARENSWAARYQIIDSALSKALSGKAEAPRIVFAYQTLSLGGVEVVLETRVVELRRRGWRVLLLFLEELDGRVLFENTGVEIRICRDDSEIAKGLAEFKPDWIVSIDTPPILPIARQIDPEVKLVYEVHSTYSHMLAPLVGKDLLTGVRGIIVPSRSLRTRVESLVSSRGVPMEVVPNSLAPIFLEAGEEAETPSRPVVLWVGRIDSVKNWLAFLDIATQLRDRFDAEFHLISGGFAGGAEQEQVVSKIAASGLEERFHWLQAVAHRRMPALYRSVARSGGCLVSTSVDESFGLAVLEAMACRCPVVVPDIESLRDLVQQDETGHLYPTGDIDAACEQIVQVLQGSEEQRQAITEKAFQTASHYAPGIATDRFLTVLRDWSLPPRASEMPAEPARLVHIREAISQILAKKSKLSKTVIFPPSVRWEDGPLNGRAKRWARAFAGRNCTVFYSDPQYLAANPEPFAEIEPGIFVGNVPVHAYDVVDAPIVFVNDSSVRQLDFLHNPHVVYECPQSPAGGAEWLARSSVVITYSQAVRDTVVDLRPDVVLVQESLFSWDGVCSQLMDAIQSAEPSDPARMRALLAWREGQVAKLEAQIRDRDRPAVNVLHSTVTEQKRILAQRNEGIAFLRSELASRERIIAKRDEAIAFLRGEAAHFQERLRAADKEIERLRGALPWWRKKQKHPS
jgi:polysaccharide pyruvyl transferase CsaB